MNEIPDGIHCATVRSHRVATSQNGTPQLVVEFENDLGLSKWYQPLTERSLPVAVDQLRLLGFDLEAENYAVDLLDDTNLLVGRQADVLVAALANGWRRVKRLLEPRDDGSGTREFDGTRGPSDGRTLAEDLRRIAARRKARDDERLQ